MDLVPRSSSVTLELVESDRISDGHTPLDFIFCGGTLAAEADAVILATHEILQSLEWIMVEDGDDQKEELSVHLEERG